MRYIHGGKTAAPRSPSGDEEIARATKEVLEIPSAAAASNGNASGGHTRAREYLVAAIDTLDKRAREIADDISSLEALRIEKEAIGRELEAVNVALRTFDAAAANGG